MNETRMMPLLNTRAMVVPSTINEDDRTVEVVWSTGAKGLRGGYMEEPYMEELDMSDSAIRMGRLNNGASVLKNHGQHSLDNVIGAVVPGSARTDGKEGTAKLKISSREDVEPLFRDMRDGIMTHISVGYRVHKYERIRAKDGEEYDTLRATDWEPMELSFVPIAFDDAARTRSDEELSAVKICDTEREANTATPNQPKEGEPMAEENAKTEGAVQDDRAAPPGMAEPGARAARLPAPPDDERVPRHRRLVLRMDEPPSR